MSLSADNVCNILQGFGISGNLWLWFTPKLKAVCLCQQQALNSHWISFISGSARYVAYLDLFSSWLQGIFYISIYLVDVVQLLSLQSQYRIAKGFNGWGIGTNLLFNLVKALFMSVKQHACIHFLLYRIYCHFQVCTHRDLGVVISSGNFIIFHLGQSIQNASRGRSRL